MNKSDIRSLEELMDCISDGTIDATHVAMKILQMNKRKEILKNHKNKIWKDSDGYWNTYLDAGTARKRIRKKNKSDIDDVIISFYDDLSNNPTISEVFNEWNDRRFEIGKIAASTYERNQQTFNRHYTDFGCRKISDVCPEDFSDFLESEIFSKGLSTKAFSNLKSITKGFLIRAKKRNLIAWNVADMMETIDVSERDFVKKIREDSDEVFNDEEMTLIINYIFKNPSVKNLAILLMFVTGIRVGELVTLKRSDFDGNSFKVRRTESRRKTECGYEYFVKEYPKTQAGIRTEVIPKDYEWVVAVLMNQWGGGKMPSRNCDDFLFTDAGSGKRITTNSVRRRLSTICKNLGIPHKSPHKIRKTYGSILLDNNIDKNLIIGLMGHTDIATTEKHYHRNRKNLDRKAEIVSSIPEFQLSEHTFEKYAHSQFREMA